MSVKNDEVAAQFALKYIYFFNKDRKTLDSVELFDNSWGTFASQRLAVQTLLNGRLWNTKMSVVPLSLWLGL